MNWQVFGISGYASVALWVGALLLWIVYWRGRQQPLRHLAAALAIAAFVCAKINSSGHVNRIETIATAPLADRGSREEAIRQAALEGRSSEVAQISFAEDAAGEFLDKAGMDESDLKYLGGGGKSAVPDWKRQKQTRSQDAAKDSSPEDKLISQIGGPEAKAGMDADIPDESSKRAPLRMTAADVATAHRLDRLNLGVSLGLVVVSVFLLVVDYLRRANNYALATSPLPLPSTWLNSFHPIPPVVVRPRPPRRSIPAELEWLARRGDPFLYLTDKPADADAAFAHFASRPRRRRPEVLRVTDGIGDEFIFESLWYGRGSFILDSIDHMEYLLPRFINRLEQRRTTRARVRQTAHIVWDVSAPLPESTHETLVSLARSTGFSLLLA